MEIYAVNISEILTGAILESLILSVGDKINSKIENCVNRDEKVRLLVSEIMKKIILSRKSGVPVKEIKLEYNIYGKPFFTQYPQLHFNISHSGCWIVMALDNLPIGIDIEQVKPIDLEVAKAFFSLEENEAIKRKSGYDKLLYFYDMWTIKEAFIKAKGEGLSLPLNSFVIKKKANCIFLNNCRDSEKYYFKQFRISNGYKLSICAQNNMFCKEVYKVRLKDLCNDFLNCSFINW